MVLKENRQQKRCILAERDVPLDLIVVTPMEYEQYSDVVGHILYPAVREAGCFMNIQPEQLKLIKNGWKRRKKISEQQIIC